MPETRHEIRSILATDCGSTTTKAILIEKRGDEYRLIVRGEAPTTVEAPFEDVTKGVLNAIEEVEELSGKKFIEDGRLITPQRDEKTGADVYVSTSSAGGGLQMMVGGLVLSMTAESAKRAALGAGAIVMDAIATNDGRLPHEKIERIRHLRPDMILLAGAVDNGTPHSKAKVVELAELIAAANPKARLGIQYKLPIVYAGTKDARDDVQKVLGEKTALKIVENIRPVLERENLLPARNEIHEQFMEHVMANAPGYKKLMAWTDAPIMPTPGAVGYIMQLIAHMEKINVVGVDIGGATTDIFSVWRHHDEKLDKWEEIFNRTVSANLGMSYSVSNVLAEAGLAKIMRWVPFHVEERELRNRIKNKMIRPTTIPQGLEELIIEQAIAREALRLAFIQHKDFAQELKGVSRVSDISQAFRQAVDKSIVKMPELDMLVGSGGVLSHAPRRNQAMMMMIDSFLPEGITRMAVDSIFMMPQLGVLANIQKPELEESAKKAAIEVFHKDCLIKLGTCIASKTVPRKPGRVMTITFTMPDGKALEKSYNLGEMELIPLELDKKAKARIVPERGIDVGAGPGRTLEGEAEGGVVGIVVDARGRIYTVAKDATGKPFLEGAVPLPEDDAVRVQTLRMWHKALDIYPDYRPGMTL
jgi:uncharacterized protein (TIGR01319 family)